QIKPPLLSFIILSNALLIFCRASSGIVFNLPCNCSFTKSYNDFPNKLDCQIFDGSPSNSSKKYLTNSSLCFSVPIRGDTSVVISHLKKCKEGALAFSFTPNLLPCLYISGSFNSISSILGLTNP